MTKSTSVGRQALGGRWERALWVIIVLVIVALCAAAFLPRVYNGRSASALLTLILLALCAAIALHVRFLLRARLAHGETARVLHAAEREFESIFDSVPDAIVILDGQGICLEANPAALALFGTAREDLMGHAIQKFYLTAHSSANAQ